MKTLKIPVVNLILLCIIILTGTSCERHKDLDEIIDKSYSVLEGYGITGAGTYNIDSNNLHKVVIIHMDRSRRHKKWNYDLPSSWLPKKLSELELVVVVSRPNYQEIENCCYSNTGFMCSYRVTRRVNNTVVDIRSAKTGAILKGRTFSNYPGECPETSSSSYNKDGADVELKDIETWVGGFVNGTDTLGL